LIVLVLDNGGFAVINKLQNNTGNESFNNLIADCPTVPEAVCWSILKHMPHRWVRIAETVSNPAELGEAFKRAKAANKTYVICMKVDAYEGWTRKDILGGKSEPRM
jgi:3D-(3,5/4)-trihydroxycyclohexane-1,2-dione acylhydrolase (decyclizing)